MKTKKRYGYIVAGPSEFAIHRRGGATRHAGRGISFFALPWLDDYYLIPSTSQSVSFAADQITAENQGVQVEGFAVWKIADPEKASTSFDFRENGVAVGVIGDHLRQVVESAIRHQVANMTMEDVLRKRGSIILQLKNELAYMAEQWGLAIETVEIRTVRVLSEQLFERMQARFRDAMRLESETSALETERMLSERRLAQQEEMSLKQREFERNELERASEARRAKIAADAAVEAFQCEQQMDVVSAKQRLQAAQAALELERERHEASVAAIEDETLRRQIATSNTKSHALELVKQLPTALGALKVEELHLGDDVLRDVARGLRGLAGNGVADHDNS
jgi:regulator of protease activity HflC (stomatin/prohibitin superfamily)